MRMLKIVNRGRDSDTDILTAKCGEGTYRGRLVSLIVGYQDAGQYESSCGICLTRKEATRLADWLKAWLKEGGKQ